MRIILWLVDAIAKFIVQGNWTTILIILAVGLALGYVYFSLNSRTNIPTEYIIAALLVFGLIVAYKFAQKDNAHHPENFVGHTYDLSRQYLIYASPTEQGMYDYEMEYIKTRHEQGAYPAFDYTQKCGIVNLVDEPKEMEHRTSWGTLRSPKRLITRLTVVNSARANTDAPLVEVKVENNAYAGGLYWIPSRVLCGGGCIKFK